MIRWALAWKTRAKLHREMAKAYAKNLSLARRWSRDVDKRLLEMQQRFRDALAENARMRQSHQTIGGVYRIAIGDLERLRSVGRSYVGTLRYMNALPADATVDEHVAARLSTADALTKLALELKL